MQGEKSDKKYYKNQEQAQQPIEEQEESFLPEVVDEQKRDLLDIIPNPSSFPIFNRFERRKIESYIEVIKAGTDLVDAMNTHSRIWARLKDIDTEIETEKLERRNKLREVQRATILNNKKDQIAQLELEVQEAELQERLKQLKTSPIENKLKQQPKPKTLEEIKQQTIRQIQAEREIEEALAQATKEMREEGEKKGYSPELIEEMIDNFKRVLAEKGIRE